MVDAFDKSYDDLVERFEDEINIDEIRTSDDLYLKLRSWFPRHQPKQKQMDIFTQRYNLPFYEVPQEDIYYLHTFKKGQVYNKDTRELIDTKDNWHIVEEFVYHFKYGDRVVLRDVDTKRVYAHYKDEEGFLSEKQQ